MTDDDPLLRLAGHIDGGRDAVDGGLFAVLLYRYLHTVRDLLLVIQKYLLTDDLRSEETHRPVGERIFRIVGFPFGQLGENQVEESSYIETVQCRYGHHVGSGQARAPLLGKRLQSLLGSEIDLVDHHDDRYSAGTDTVHDPLRGFVAPLHRIRHVEDDVGILQRSGDELHHRLLQTVTGLEDTGRIGVDDLEIVAVHDSHDPVTRGLRLGGDDGQTLAHERIHKCRLSHIGIAYDIDETRLVHIGDFMLAGPADLRTKIKQIELRTRSPAENRFVFVRAHIVCYLCTKKERKIWHHRTS